MRQMYSIQLFRDNVPGGAVAFLSSLGFGSDVVEIVDTLYCVSIPADDERVPRLRAELGRLGQLTFEGWYDEYTQEELDNARLLFLRPTNGCEIDGNPAGGTDYDFTKGCPACGTGAPQVTPLITDVEFLAKLEGHPAAQTWFGDFLVSERVANELAEQGLSGLTLRSVYALDEDTRRQIKLRWMQVCAARTLPPMSAKTSGLGADKQCPVCKRDGFDRTGKEGLRVTYRAEDLAKAEDVNESWEWFGFSAASESDRKRMEYNKVGRPHLIVTPKFMHALRAAGVTDKYVDYLPIRVLDE